MHIIIEGPQRHRRGFIVPFVRQDRYGQYHCRANGIRIGNLAQGVLLVNDPMFVFNASGRGDTTSAPISSVSARA